MSEQIIVVSTVGLVFAVFFYMAHRADQVVKEKAKRELDLSKSIVKDEKKKDGRKAG